VVVLGGIEGVAAAIGAELLRRLPAQNKKQREGIALLVSTALSVRSVNLNELASALPRRPERLDMRYQWISRVLGNDLIGVDAVMAPFAREVLARAAQGGGPVVLAIDQSQANEGHQMLMVSLRLGERALPVAWRMRRAKGTLGFDVQKEVLEVVVALLGKGTRVLLMGDRFYGSPALIGWCREQGWGWRLRCKESLIVLDANGEETTLGACFARGERLMSDVLVTRKHALTNVAMFHSEGHKAPWIIALSDPPTTEHAAEYRQRWGIEAMFSDYKTRGFNLEASQIERTDRLDRLVMILSLALYWAVSTGMWDAIENPRPAEKKPQQQHAGTSHEA
jgi:hypothetical protein